MELRTALPGDFVEIESCWVTANIAVEHDGSFTVAPRLEFIYQQIAIVIATVDEHALGGDVLRFRYVVTTTGIRGWAWGP